MLSFLSAERNLINTVTLFLLSLNQLIISMKKISPLILFAGILLFSASCSSNTNQQKDSNQVNVPSDELKLDSKDVKGTITAPGASVSPYTLTTNIGTNSKMVSFDGESVRIDPKAVINIVPSFMPLDSLVMSKQKDAEMFGKFDIVEKDPNGVLYHTLDTAFSEKTEGYNIIVVIKGKSKMYRISAEGDTPMKPIADKQLAEKAFKTALTFKPAE